MLIVTDLHGQSEPLVDYRDLEVNEEVNGDFSINFTTISTPNNEFAFPLLKEESIVQTEDQHEFRIKKLRSNRNRKIINVAQHIFFDLNGDQVYDIIGGSKDANEMFSFILKDTGWTFEVLDDIPYRLFTNFGQDNVVSLIRKACEILECEIKIEPNKHLKIYKEMGSDDDFQYRYKHNIKGLQQDIDTTNLTTVVKGFGASGMVVTYKSPNASMLGEIHASPIRDEQITDEAEMIELLKHEINDTPIISIEVEEINLGETKQLGDKVWLIYEPLGIEFQTRIMARKIYPNQVGKNTVTFGNFKREISNIVAETAKETNKNRSKIDQTSDRITLEVERIDESISRIELTADQITLSVQNLEKDLKSEISITDSEIRSMVSQEVKTLNDKVDKTNSTITQTASSIRSEVSKEVNRIDGAISSANSSITQLSNRITSEVQEINYDMSSMQTQINQTAYEISSKVSRTDYNGLTISSLINQDAYRIQLSAQAIDLQGITNVASQLTLGTGWGGYASIRFNGQANIYTNTGSDLYVSSANLFLNDGTVWIDRLNLGRSMAYEAGYFYAPSGSLSIGQNTVKANTITQLSNADLKKNISDWELNATEMICSTPIRQYQYKDELEGEFPHVGIVVQEAPVWVVDVEGSGVEPYKMSTLAWKAIQELKQEIDSLKEKLNGVTKIE